MEIGTMITHLEADVMKLDKVASDIKLEECHPIEFYQNLAESVYGVKTSLDTLRQAVIEKVDECYKNRHKI